MSAQPSANHDATKAIVLSMASSRDKPRKPVMIGSRYSGEHRVVRDRASGEYSESLPPIEGYALTLQQALAFSRVS